MQAEFFDAAGKTRTEVCDELGRAGIPSGPCYTAPEVMTGNPATVTSDIYSLGATIYALISGAAAHGRRSGEDLIAQYLRISTTRVPDMRPEGIPDGVCAAIEKAMSINDSPVVVDFTVGQDAMVWPMVAAGSSNDDIQAARDLRPIFDGTD